MDKIKESKRKYNQKMKQISIRVTLDDYKIIKEKAEKLNLKPTTFIRYSAINKKLPKSKTDNKTVLEINKIGNNFNQITKKINAGFKINNTFAKELQNFRYVLEEILNQIKTRK